MSTQEIGALIQSVNDMTGTVAGKMSQIDQRVADAESEYQALISGIRSDFPFYALTENQQLKFGGAFDNAGGLTHPDGFYKRGAGVVVELHETVPRQELPAVRSAESQALFTDLYGFVPRYIFNDFNIIKITFNDNLDIPSNYSIYQGPINRTTAVTHGAMIKVVSGECRFGTARHLTVPSDGKWHEMVEYRDMAPGMSNAYDHGPHIAGALGTVILVALPAVAAGKVPQGKWGYINKPTMDIESFTQP